MKKFLSTLVVMIFCCLLVCMVVACDDESNNQNSTDNTDAEIMAIYDTYVAYAQENGTTPLSYEEWLATIKGEKGEKGDIGPQGPKGETGENGLTPLLKIGEDNYWYVSYDNGTTWASLNVKATGPKGEQGIQGEPGKDGVDGETGHTPKITIGENSNWFVDGVDTGVKAEYVQEKLTVTFHTYGAAILDEKYTQVDDSTYTIQVNKGDALTLPVPKKAGYYFICWSMYDYEKDYIMNEGEFINWGDCWCWDNFMPIVRDLDLWAEIDKDHSCLSDDGDHVCDKCYEALDCVDNNNDHNCDYGKEVLTICSDTNNDHNCDVCKKVLSICLDDDNNHNCDMCKKTLTTCVNYNEDHFCDICGCELDNCVDYILQANPDEQEYILLNGCPICGGSPMLEYNLKDDDTYEISGANRSIVSLGLPIIINNTRYNGKEVTSIRENAFDDCDNAVIYNVTTLDIVTDNSSITIINNAKELSSGYDDEILEFNGFGYVEGDTDSLLVYYVGEANKVVLPQKLTYLGATDSPMTFWGSKASSIVIHSNVKQIQTFGVFSSITDIYYTGTEEQWNEVAQAGWDMGLEDYTIHYNYVIEAHECIYEDAGHFCDVCGACADENKDHYCDVCEKQSSECEDTDNNHMCDVCEKELSVCEDTDNNHMCDVCEKALMRY